MLGDLIHIIFIICLFEFTGFRNGDLGTGSSRIASNLFDVFDNVFSLQDLSKNNMTPIQPSGLHSGDKELRTLIFFTVVSNQSSGVCYGCCC